MVCAQTQFSEVNVLASETNWAWPKAIGDIFRPRGVNLIVAETVGEFVDVLRQKRVHALIVDADVQRGGFAAIRIVRMDFPRLPCLVLTERAGQEVLRQALHLDVFSVLGKPVDMTILQTQLNKLFVKNYNSDVFA